MTRFDDCRFGGDCRPAELHHGNQTGVCASRACTSSIIFI
jgi:hypothetical protein